MTISTDFVIANKARAYLVNQRGNIKKYHEDRDVWHKAYECTIHEIYLTIRHSLPSKATSVLDIGSGLGGINVLLSRHYGGGLREIALLDQLDGRPQKSDKGQFSNATVSYEFLRANGIHESTSLMYIEPSDAALDPVYARAYCSEEGPDLVFSFGSWCFHFSPVTYLPFLKLCCRPDTVVILDVRKGRPDWTESLERQLKPERVLWEEAKYQRILYRPK